MPSVFLSTEDKRKADADLFERQARQRLADAWENSVRLRLPDLIGETQQKLASVVHPDLATGAGAPSAPPPAAVPTAQPPLAAPAAPVASLPPTSAPQPSPFPTAGGADTPSQQGGDLRSFARAAASRAGIDPDLFERQIQQESGFNPSAASPAGAQGIAQIVPQYHPQADVTDPYKSLEYAANLMRSHVERYGGDIQKALAAYNAGPGAVEKYGGVPPFEETKRYVESIMGGQQVAPPAPAGPPASGQRSQFALGLSAEDAYAACGPAAALAFANQHGRYPTAEEALTLAKKYGWTKEQGMAGILSEQKLLSEGLGIPTKLEERIDWNHVASDAANGNPVIVSTPGHYFYVSGSRKAQTGETEFYVGTSGTDLKGGAPWMTAAAMQQRMGQAQGALYADNPQSPGQSIASSGPAMPVNVPGGGFDPSHMQAITRPAQPGIPLKQDVRDLGLQPQPTIFDQPSGPNPREPVVRDLYARTRPGEEPTPQLIQRGIEALQGGEGAAVGMNVGKGAAKAVAGVAQAVTEPHGLTINLPKYTPPEVREIIEQAYQANPMRMDEARRGVISDEVVRDLASQVGRTPAQIASLWKPGQAKNAETILALRQGLADQSQAVLAAQKAVQANPASMDAQSALVQALLKHASVQELVTGVTAEAGRALRQFRQPIEGQQASVIYLQKLAKQWKVEPDVLAGAIAKADLNDPLQVAGLARNLVKHTPRDWAEALWYFNLLSNPLSHIRNVVSNTLTAVIGPLESVPSATIDVARSKITGAPRERFFGETAARYVGLGAGLREGGKEAAQILAHGLTSEQAAGQLAGSRAATQLPGKAGVVLSVPGRALGAEDALFRGVNSTSALYAGAYRQASQEGLKGAELTERVAQLRAAPTPELLAESAAEGAYRVFQSPSELANAITGITNKYPALKVVVPFVRTPVNIAKYAIQYSPGGLGTLLLDAARGQAGSAGMVEDRLARVAIGSSVLTGLILYAKDGNLTGAPPESPAERDAFLRRHPAYSIKVGDQWVNYQAMQPFSSLFAAAASIHQAQEKGMTKEPEAAAAMVSFAIAKSMTDMPWLQGLTQALEAQHDPQKMGGAYLESLARSAAFPTSIWSFINRATDNMLRSPENPAQAFVGQYPGMTGVSPPRQNAWGADVERPKEQTGFLGALNPFAGAQVKNDPVETALNELQLKGYNVQPGFVGKTVTVPKLGQPVTLTSDEQRELQKTSGQLAYGILLPIVSDPRWSSMTPEARAKIIDTVIDRSRDYARTQMMPRLIPRGIEAFNEQYATGIRKPAPKP